MKKITSRTFICFFLALVLAAGTGVFTVKLLMHGSTWASFTANKHLYVNETLNAGRILDRDGDVLARHSEEQGEWVFSDDYTIRRATLHAVGDRNGMIGTGALKRFADKLTGYNLITGAKSVLTGGRDLYLTLDDDVCKAAYNALNGRKGTIGVYNYETGEIICMVSAPSYDPSNPPTIKDGDERYEGVYINRLLSTTFVPGSTFKLVTLAAALENIDDIETRTFECNAATVVGEQVITCPSKHGTLSIEDALAVSCNGVFGQLAAELGAETMQKYVESTGLTDELSVNGIPTAVSTFNFPADNDGELAWAGIGQGKDMVNPCSMMVLSGAIANGGRAAKPQIISHTAFQKGVRTSLYLRHSTGELLNKDTANRIAEMMKNNVVSNYGEGNFPGLDIYAKTGTAQVDSTSPYNAWFTGFIKNEEHPYAFVVLIEGGGSGKNVAGKAANAVLQAAIR